MIRKTITFHDLDGNKLEEDFYFNFTSAELAEMELSMPGGMRAHLTNLIETNDGAKIMSAFKDIIRKSYGKRSSDARRFQKSEELWLEFEQTDAYTVLFIELVTDAEKAAEFVKGLLPKELEDHKKPATDAEQQARIESLKAQLKALDPKG